MDRDELTAQLGYIFEPEPDEDGHFLESPPAKRLATVHKLDTGYWRTFEYGSTSSLNRLTTASQNEVDSAIRAQTIPYEIFVGTLQLFGDSILHYHERTPRQGPYRYYPGILISGWAAFEAYVRVYSELLVKTVLSIPPIVNRALLETEEFVDDGGKVKTRFRPRPILERYRLYLKYAFEFEADKGSRYWQQGQASLDKRNELVHYAVTNMPSLKATELWEQLEAILVMMIAPSAHLKFTIMPSLYEIYAALEALKDLLEEYEERPWWKDRGWKDNSNVLFSCPFVGVDDVRYPSVDHMSAKRKLESKK